MKPRSQGQECRVSARSGKIAPGFSGQHGGRCGQNDDPQALGNQHIGHRHRVRATDYETQVDGNDQGKRSTGQRQQPLQYGYESLHERYPRETLDKVGQPPACR